MEIELIIRCVVNVAAHDRRQTDLRTIEVAVKSGTNFQPIVGRYLSAKGQITGETTVAIVAPALLIGIIDIRVIVDRSNQLAAHTEGRLLVLKAAVSQAGIDGRPLAWSLAHDVQDAAYGRVAIQDRGRSFQQFDRLDR